MKKLKVYVAGKVSKDSHFGKHHWRDEFCSELSELSGVELENLDPLKHESDPSDTKGIFKKDCQLISGCDVFVVYLSNDISVGGSQEILIARYLSKPVIGFAPRGGKFNGSSREMLGQVIEDYRDPFVFSTCDVVCGDMKELAESFKKVDQIKSTGLEIIDDVLEDK